MQLINSQNRAPRNRPGQLPGRPEAGRIFGPKMEGKPYKTNGKSIFLIIFGAPFRDNEDYLRDKIQSRILARGPPGEALQRYKMTPKWKEMLIKPIVSCDFASNNGLKHIFSDEHFFGRPKKTLHL